MGRKGGFVATPYLTYPLDPCHAISTKPGLRKSDETQKRISNDEAIRESAFVAKRHSVLSEAARPWS